MKKKVMSYQEQVRAQLNEFAKLNLTDQQIAAGLMTELVIVMAVIADELNDINKRLRNGETVQEGSD